MKKEWADAKRYLFEDIVVYSAILAIDLIFDWIVNILLVTHVYSTTHETVHAYQIGAFQAFIGVFCIVQLVRKWIDYRYWK